MVSRRTFLAGSAAALGAGGVGIAHASPAAAAGTSTTAAGPGDRPGIHWPGRQLLPSFARPHHLHVADVSSARGEDQLLLTTLQGIVNRTRPEIYLEFDPVDATWAAGAGVPSTAHANPLDLVGRYRDRVKGAVIYDPRAPHSINVATTYAGLLDGVVADADQAREHKLPVLKDLRGTFDDDPIATYRWQFRHLWQRCNQRLVTGLNPTQVVDVEGVEWTEVATETRQLRNSENKGSFTFDCSAALGGDTVYVRFSDSFTDDGWGPSVTTVEATLDGEVIASFSAGTPAEEAFLFDGRNSSIGGEDNRFSDGGGYFVYAFPTGAGAQKLELTVYLWGQYHVEVTDTAPTRVEPFAYFRDYVVATKAMLFWLAPNGAEGDLLTEILDATAATTPYLGWFSNNVAGEWGGVDLASRSSVEVIAADFYLNGTVHGGLQRRISDHVRTPKKKTLANKVYVTLTVGEGDNIQYCQRRMRDLWDDPARGEVPTNWTISPLLLDAGPAIYKYFQQTASGNDLLVCGPSGAGYTYGGAWPETTLDRYTQLSGRYLRRSGLDLVYAYNNRDEDGWITPPPRVLRSYQRFTPLKGMIMSWGSGELLATKPLPVIGNFAPVGKAADYMGSVTTALEQWDGDSPFFIAGAIDAWGWTPTDIVELAGLLAKNDDIELVLGDTFFRLLAKAGARATAPTPAKAVALDYAYRPTADRP